MKWIKLAAIIGFVFTGLLLLLLILSFVNENSFLYGGDRVLNIVISIIYLVAFFFFMFGFVKVGQNTNHKLLKNSSWMLIVSAIVGVLFLGLINSGQPAEGNLNQDTLNEINRLFDEQNLNLNYDNSYLTGNAIGNLFSGETTFGLILIIILALFSLVGVSLFLVSIAEHRDKVRFSRQASFFPFFTFNAVFLIMILSVLWAFIFMFSSGGKFLLSLTIIIPYLLAMVSVLFLSLFLLDASKKYENGEQTEAPREYREYSPYPSRARVTTNL